MKIIAVMNQKGGAGKTTLAVHLATAAQLAGLDAVVLDMDMQGTAEAWSSWRQERAGKDSPAVIGAKAATLPRWLGEIEKEGAALAVIDTPPLAEGQATKAAQIADLILIPCRPAGFDLHAMQLTADLARTIRKPAFVVFNAGPPRKAAVYDEATETVSALGIEVAPGRISERAIFKSAILDGLTAQEAEPGGKGAAEVAALWHWIAETLSLK